ncbi:MAG: hypothetical protein ACLTTO_14815 [Lachnospiraceae bacterium]
MEQTKLAKSLGMTILITDHHRSTGEEIPPADAVSQSKAGRLPLSVQALMRCSRCL